MAQTMPDALFGLIFVAAAPPVAYFIAYNYISYNILVSIQKKKKKRKIIAYGPNDNRCVIRAHFHNCCLPIVYYNIYIL